MYFARIALLDATAVKQHMAGDSTRPRRADLSSWMSHLVCSLEGVQFHYLTDFFMDKKYSNYKKLYSIKKSYLICENNF